MNMIIGGFTPSIQPGEMTIVRPDKPVATKETYGGVAYFAWPASIIGKVVEVTWNLLTAADFASLDALYVADAPVAFDPSDGSGKTYTVNILALDGRYLLQFTKRADVKLRLLIMSEIP